MRTKLIFYLNKQNNLGEFENLGTHQTFLVKYKQEMCYTNNLFSPEIEKNLRYLNAISIN